MKKYLLGTFAVILAIGMSAFTHENRQSHKKSDMFVNWFSAIDHSYVTTTSTLDAPAGQCSNTGSGCLEGFSQSSENENYPGGTPSRTYKE
jgi:hypothetical protein